MDEMLKSIENAKKNCNAEFDRVKMDEQENLVTELRAKWSKGARNPDIDENKAFKFEIEVKLKTIKEELASFEDALYKVLNYNYNSKTNFIKAFDSDDFFGVLGEAYLNLMKIFIFF